MTGRRHALLLALTLCATFAVYAPSLAGGFTLDDRLIAVGTQPSGLPSPRVFELQPPAVYFTTHYWADSHEAGNLFRPITTLSFALRHAVFGDAAFVAHLTNVLLHVLCTFLVYRLLLALGTAPEAAVLGTAFFGLHAIHSEVVAGIVGRAELLAFAGGAGALLLAPGGLARSLGAAACLFLAFCAKESALAWVPVGVAFAFVRRQRARAGLRARTWLALGVGPLAAFLLLRQQMMAALPADPLPPQFVINPIFSAPLGTRLMTATTALGHGLWLCLAPFRLAADYGAAVFPVRERLDLVVAASGGAILTLAVLLTVQHRRAPLCFLAGCVFLGFALVTSNHFFAIGTIFGERLYFAPSLGVSLAVAALAETSRSRLKPILLGLALVWLGGSALVAVQRSLVWHDNETLFENDVAVQPHSIRLRRGQAEFLQQKGQTGAALRHLEAALALDPEVASTWNNLGAAHLTRGHLDQAERALRHGLQAARLDRRRDLFKLHGNLGLLYAHRGQGERAASELLAALEAHPPFYFAFQRLLSLSAENRLPPERLRELVAGAAARHPHDAQWTAYRGILASEQGAFAEALPLLEEALARLVPHPARAQLHGRTRLSRAASLLGLGRVHEARPVLRALVRDPHVSGDVRATADRLLHP